MGAARSGAIGAYGLYRLAGWPVSAAQQRATVQIRGFLVDRRDFGVVLEPPQDACDQQVTLGSKYEFAGFLPYVSASRARVLRK
jgi:hypothetical protein